MCERDELSEEIVTQIRGKLEVGYRQALRGETVSGEDALRELDGRRKAWLEANADTP